MDANEIKTVDVEIQVTSHDGGRLIASRRYTGEEVTQRKEVTAVAVVCETARRLWYQLVGGGPTQYIRDRFSPNGKDVDDLQIFEKVKALVKAAEVVRIQLQMSADSFGSAACIDFDSEHAHIYRKQLELLTKAINALKGTELWLP